MQRELLHDFVGRKVTEERYFHPTARDVDPQNIS